MRIVSGALSVVAALLFSSGLAMAADVSEVVKACDNMDSASPGSCGYSINKQGDISGCSQHACFYCPADGSRQCVGVTAERTGRPARRIEGNVLDLMTGEARRAPPPAGQFEPVDPGQRRPRPMPPAPPPVERQWQPEEYPELRQRQPEFPQSPPEAQYERQPPPPESR